MPAALETVFSLFFLTSLRPLLSPGISVSGCPGCTEVLLLPFYPQHKGENLSLLGWHCFLFFRKQTGLVPAAPPQKSLKLYSLLQSKLPEW